MFEQAFKNIDDVLWKEAGCTTELDYTEQTSWLLFLKYLDGLEQDKATEAALEGKQYTYILDNPTAGKSGQRPRARTGSSTTIRLSLVMICVTLWIAISFPTCIASS
jgi:type I restriction enzyme M protein